jgi:hypothetical protein
LVLAVLVLLVPALLLPGSETLEVFPETLEVFPETLEVFPETLEVFPETLEVFPEVVEVVDSVLLVPLDELPGLFWLTHPPKQVSVNATTHNNDPTAFVKCFIVTPLFSRLPC